MNPPCPRAVLTLPLALIFGNRGLLLADVWWRFGWPPGSLQATVLESLRYGLLVDSPPANGRPALFRRIADFIWQRDMRRTIAVMRRVKAMFVKEGMTNVTIDVAQLEQKLGFLREETRGRTDLKILEIGPWTGTHSRFIDRFFNPESLTFLERPGAGRDENFTGWIDEIQCKNRIVYSDLLLANELQGEKFDIVFCFGSDLSQCRVLQDMQFPAEPSEAGRLVGIGNGSLVRQEAFDLDQV